MPVIAHIYPRSYEAEPVMDSDVENIAWAVRCGIECGADVIKVIYPGRCQTTLPARSLSPAQSRSSWPAALGPRPSWEALRAS